MIIRVLGSAAGGGFPQWNCDCPCCQAVRDGSRPARARTQSSAAVSADGGRWVLVNASPDIHRQIEAFPALRPRAREVPISTVLLTDGELDHTLGLALLREARGLRVGGTPATRDFLRNGSTLLATLEAYCPVEWTDVIPGADISLGDGLTVRAFDAPTRKKPRFPGVGEGKGRVVGYRIADERTGAAAAVLPGVQELTPGVLDELRGCQSLLVDGTCWTDDEMIALGLAGKTSRDMGHVPVSGPGGSLEALASLDVPRKVYTHLNNSNPLLLEDSAERREAEARGLEIAYDGMEIVL